MKQNDNGERDPSGGSPNESDPARLVELARRRRERTFIEGFIKIEEIELFRPVKVRVGKVTKEVPLIREVMRQLGEAALKGDKSAQIALLSHYQGDKKWLQQGNNKWWEMGGLSVEEMDELLRLLDKFWVGPKPKPTPEELKEQKRKEAALRKQQEADAERSCVIRDIVAQDRDRGRG